jgi:hypothetical protein
MPLTAGLHSAGFKGCFLSMFMGFAARLFHAKKLTVFPQFKGGTSRPVWHRRCGWFAAPARSRRFKVRS